MSNNRIVKLQLLVVLIVIITAMSISAQSSRIRIQAGAVVYPDPRIAPKIYVEFPFALHRSDFSFLISDSTTGEMVSGIYADVYITDTLDNLIDSTGTYFLTGARDSADAAKTDIRLFNRLGILLDPGIYKAKMTVFDAVSKKEGTFDYERLELEEPVLDHLNSSSLELAHQITIPADEDAAANSPLMKNGRLVIPNPMSVFSENDSVAFVYAEVYNLDYKPNQVDSFSVQFMVYKDDGTLYDGFGRTDYAMPDSSAVVCNLLSIKGYEPGKYLIAMVTSDKSSGAVDTTRTGLIIFPSEGLLNDMAKYEISHPYDTASIETKMQIVRYLMAPQDLKILEGLNEEGKHRFINQFFKDKDPDPTTPVNEYLDDVYSRYLYAIENFSTGGGIKDGWKTDRGRVLIQYGPWDERDDMMAPAYGKPWEVWEYHSLEGGSVFVFQDENGYGDYRLVHSDVSGEIYDADWEKVLKEQSPAFIE